MKIKKTKMVGNEKTEKMNTTLMQSNLPFLISLSDFLRTLAVREWSALFAYVTSPVVPEVSLGLLHLITQFFCSNSLFIPSFLNKTLTESIHHCAWWEKWQCALLWARRLPGTRGEAGRALVFFFLSLQPYLCEYEHPIPALRSLLFLCKTRKAGLYKIGRRWF